MDAGMEVVAESVCGSCCGERGRMSQGRERGR